MRFELRAVRGGSEFLAFDVDRPFDAVMEALAWQRSDHGCWSRRLRCSVAAAEPARENLYRYMQPLLRQAADLDPVPWQDALDDVCRRFAGAGGVDWFLGGSAALAVRRAPVSPHDLDLIISEADSVRTGELFADCILEPVATAEWPLSLWWGRAFLHARIEWAGGITPAADEPHLTDFGPTAASLLEVVRWRDWDLRVPPLALQRAVSERRGLAARVAVIDELMAGR